MTTASEHGDTQVIHLGSRQLRDIGDVDPGMSLPRKVMRNLGLLDDGEVQDSDIRIRFYEDGTFEGKLMSAETMEQPIWPPQHGSQ